MTTESTVAIAQPSLDDDFAALDYWNAVRDDAEREALKSGLVSLTDGVPTVHAQR